MPQWPFHLKCNHNFLSKRFSSPASIKKLTGSTVRLSNKNVSSAFLLRKVAQESINELNLGLGLTLPNIVIIFDSLNLYKTAVFPSSVHVLLVMINVLFLVFFISSFFSSLSFHYFSMHEVQPLEISLTSNCNHGLWRIEIIKLDYIHISYLFITSYTLIHPQRQVKVSQDFHKETFHLVSNWKCKIRSKFKIWNHIRTEALAWEWVCSSKERKLNLQYYQIFLFWGMGTYWLWTNASVFWIRVFFYVKWRDDLIILISPSVLKSLAFGPKKGRKIDIWTEYLWRKQNFKDILN